MNHPLIRAWDILDEFLLPPKSLFYFTKIGHNWKTRKLNTTIAIRLIQELYILEEFLLQLKSLFYFTKIFLLKFVFDLWFVSNS